MSTAAHLTEDTEDEARCWVLLPAGARKWGQAMLHQQCWCWGQDIRRREGNLLLAQGFERTRAPEGHKGSPTYRKSLENGCGEGGEGGEGGCVWLWGFGLGFAQRGRGAVFLSRAGFSPRYSPLCEMTRQAWKADHMGEFRSPSTHDECREALHLMGEALLWLAESEERVLRENGLAYRQGTLAGWDSHAVARPEDAPREWRLLSEACLKRSCLCTRGPSGFKREPAHEFHRLHRAASH